MHGEADDFADVAKLFAQFCSTSVNLSDGWLLPRHQVELERTLHDLDEDRTRTFRYRLDWQREATSIPMPSELPEKVTGMVYSPHGKHCVRVVQISHKTNPRTCLELWRQGSLISRVDGSDLHGKVLLKGTFGGLSLSPDKHRAVYVAEVEYSSCPPLFAPAHPSSRKPAADHHKKPQQQAGSKHLYREDWGEKHSGSDRLGLFVADFQHMTVRRIPCVPASVTPGQPVFWGEDVVWTGWASNGQRRLGAALCLQRPSALYLAHVGVSEVDAKPHVVLTPKLKVARAARPAPQHHGASHGSGKGLLAFLGSTDGFETHTNCLELFVLESTPGALPRCIVAVEESPRLGPAHDGFAGICLDTALPLQCWGPGGTVYFNTFVGAYQSAWRVSTEGKQAEPERVEKPSQAEFGASVRVIAVSEDALLLCWSTPCHPEVAVIQALPPHRPSGGGEGTSAELPPPGRLQSEFRLPDFQPCAVVAGVMISANISMSLRWKVEGVWHQVGGNAVLVEPDPAAHGHKPGLIMVLHGGPHSNSSTEFDFHIPFLVKATDCAVLMVNYRGSIGFGKNALESLPGQIGKQDVQDCMDALDKVLETGAFDRSRVGVMGGSHGGFLTAHLIGQYPDRFQAAAMRNPVTNIASMVSVTDIPDWTFIEALGLKSFNFERGYQELTSEVLSTMLSRSPCVHAPKVKAPTLVAVGGGDRRVPMSQGVEFYHTLRSHGVTARLLHYEVEGHALDGPECDADFWVNIAVWFKNHLPQMHVPSPEDLMRATSLGV
mmetsp:Transcript_79474/g.199782  ORF Transcript_79474/g.199782 Transcript_79474/m.199782 type:complete len:775 (+) Transcript_79474:67-2391(+)